MSLLNTATSGLGGCWCSQILEPPKEGSSGKRLLKNLLSFLLESLIQHDLARCFVGPVDTQSYPRYEHVSVGGISAGRKNRDNVGTRSKQSMSKPIVCFMYCMLLLVLAFLALNVSTARLLINFLRHSGPPFLLIGEFLASYLTQLFGG